ncbi:2-amino-4-hydroxy-6-hydroxymethyldihydropteridine diphosphokinase [Nevskia ramosa]|uniref:2-amino-4-hydroxy-6- hydroxymethyldihydropteridine diphosphokinase n=1 Tax=Nevskia ramosa TaxID=64002 RepID=UPI0003B683E1|nr:2-amino-4-hydroxy-6-hydroxymethyldihydropteridine diphosphokinase [Nevskia ramosa]
MRVYLGLGANLGAPAVQVERALMLIAALPDTRLVARSSLYRSDPVGPAGQPDYCNAACMIDTTLEPLALLDAMQAIEVDAGRIRDGIRWAARLLDIDLLHIEGLSLSTPRLRLPHPHLQERNWVLVPLADFAPTLDIPGLGVVSELAERLGRSGLRAWS